MELIIALLLVLVVSAIILLLVLELLRLSARNQDLQITADRLRGQLHAALRIPSKQPPPDES
jgi:hypothetical protein